MITVQNTINASVDRVWEIWTIPEHIQNWNYAYDNWHTPYAENDLKVSGKFKYTMATKDKSMQFDFEGLYTKVEKYSIIEYKLTDGRTGSVHFENNGDQVKITEVFEPETGNPESMQKEWCQNVIDHFKAYVESL
nr:SRPBCC domain-containing protein [Flavobacterium sp. ASV13]